MLGYVHVKWPDSEEQYGIYNKKSYLIVVIYPLMPSGQLSIG